MEGRGREKKAKKEHGSSWLQESGWGPGCLKSTGEGRMWYRHGRGSERSRREGKGFIEKIHTKVMNLGLAETFQKAERKDYKIRN